MFTFLSSIRTNNKFPNLSICSFVKRHPEERWTYRVLRAEPNTAKRYIKGWNKRWYVQETGAVCSHAALHTALLRRKKL